MKKPSKNQDVADEVTSLRRKFNDQLGVADLMDMTEKHFLTQGRSVPDIVVKKSIANSFRDHPHGSFVATDACDEQYWFPSCKGRMDKIKGWVRNPVILIPGILFVVVFGIPLLRGILRGLSMVLRPIF